MFFSSFILFSVHDLFSLGIDGQLGEPLDLSAMFSQVAVASCLSCVVFWTRMLDFS